MSPSVPSVYIIGRLREEFVMTHRDNALPAHLGGPATYAACAARIWQSEVTLVSRLWAQAPRGWQDALHANGIRTDLVHIIPEAGHDPVFLHQASEGDILDHHPAAHYLRAEIKLPKALIGYTSSRVGEEVTASFTPHTIQPVDLETRSLQGAGVHLCSGHFLTHATIPFRARELGARFISLTPSPSYMNPSFREKVAEMVQGLDALLLDEASCRRFFQREALDLPGMMEALGDMGVGIIVVKCQDGHAQLWDRSQGSHWTIPSYPGRSITSIGAGDAFGGGFITGMLLKEDPVEACLYGSVAESLASEGYGPWYAAGAHPSLASLRLTALRETISRRNA